MTFRILGLDPAIFVPLFGLTESELASHGVKRMWVDSWPGFPDRIEVADVPVGESVLLLNYTHQPADTPYRSSHAIFVREFAKEPLDVVNVIPKAMERRTISLRSFNRAHEMVDATLVEGRNLKEAIESLLSGAEAAYLHAHYAMRGCYAARIERA